MERQINVSIRRFELICKVNNVDFLEIEININFSYHWTITCLSLTFEIHTYLILRIEHKQTHPHSNMFIDTP